MPEPKTYSSDQPTTDDHLNFKDFQKALCEIIRTADTPLTIGIYGEWGSGKTSLMKMLVSDLTEEKEDGTEHPIIHPVWFTAWKYENQEALWRAFMLRVLNALYFFDGGKKKAKKDLTEAEQEIHFKIDQLIESIYRPVEWNDEISFQFQPEQAKLQLAKLPAALVLRLVGQGSAAEKWGIDPDFSKLIKEGQEHYLGQLQFLEQFEQKFKEIIELRFPANERLVVFVDDLDRCLPEKAVEILEAIKLFLNVEHTVFVLGMDRQIISKGIEIRYHDYIDEHGDTIFTGNEYLHKLIQIPFSLPPIDANALQEFFKKEQVKENFELEDVTLGVFANGLKPNPRQAKRMLNIFKLLRTTAQNRNDRYRSDQEEEKVFDYSWPLLAKTVLIQSQWPKIYADWLRFPGLILKLEQQLGTKPNPDDLMVGTKRWKLSIEQDGEEPLEAKETLQTDTSQSVLYQHLNENWQDTLLRQLLAYPNDAQKKSLGDDLPTTKFLNIGTTEMMGYLALSGTVESSTSDIQPVNRQQADQNLLSRLTSGEDLDINEAIKRINQQKDPEAEKISLQQELIVNMRERTLPAKQRVNAGKGLAVLGDPRFREDLFFLLNDDMLGFIEIPKGKFLMGSDPAVDSYAQDREQPQHPLTLPTYYMAKYPVTVAQYKRFAQEEGKEHRGDGRYGSYPVVNVNWHDALAYCQWLTGKMKANRNCPAKVAALLQQKWVFMLPSEAEWEKAARGDKGLIYPYGNQFDAQKGNTSETEIGVVSAVGCFPEGASPSGCEEMSGNVWEWTRSKLKDYKYDPNDGREDLSGEGLRVLRGGSFDGDENDARCASRFKVDPFDWSYGLGFRVCLLPPNL